jgi:hypothetical protein
VYVDAGRDRDLATFAAIFLSSASIDLAIASIIALCFADCRNSLYLRAFRTHQVA